MNPAKAVAFVTFPILPTGLIRLKLRQLLLKTALYRLASLQREAEVAETRSVDIALDTCNLPTLRNVSDADNLNPDHPQLRHQRVPFPKKASIPDGSYPHLFPVPPADASQGHGDQRQRQKRDQDGHSNMDEGQNERDGQSTSDACGRTGEVGASTALLCPGVSAWTAPNRIPIGR
jgi:hypothetical protein